MPHKMLGSTYRWLPDKDKGFLEEVSPKSWGEVPTQTGRLSKGPKGRGSSENNTGCALQEAKEEAS